jgi:prevent-host-death family protein
MNKEKEVSISNAREHLPTLVRDAERGHTVTLTRRGKPVAVLISTERYRTHTKSKVSFGKALLHFRAEFDLEELDIGSIYEDVRDRSGGRLVEL